MATYNTTTNESCKKVVIQNYSEARHSIAKQAAQGRRLFVYVCPVCGLLHLTSSRPFAKLKRLRTKKPKQQRKPKIKPSRSKFEFIYTGGLQLYLHIVSSCSISLLRHKTRILQRGRFMIKKKNTVINKK